MAATHRSDSALIPGYHHSGDRGLGVLGSQAASSGLDGAGYWFQCLELPADAANEYKAPILVPPALGTLFAEEDGRLTFDGPDGVHTYTFGLDENGVRLFEVTNTFVVGGGTLTGDAAWDLFSATGSVAPGAFSVLSGAAAWDLFSASGAVTAGAPSVLSGPAAWDLFSALGDIAPGAFVGVLTGAAEWQVFDAIGLIVGEAVPEALDMYTLRAPEDQIRNVGGFAPKDPDAEVVVAFQFKRFTTQPSSPDMSIVRLRGAADASPNPMLEGVPAVVGSVVFQRVVGGVPQCDYQLRCEVDGPDGTRYAMVGTLPVRPAK